MTQRFQIIKLGGRITQGNQRYFIHHAGIVQNILVLRHRYNPAEMRHILSLRKIAYPELALVVVIRGRDGGSFLGLGGKRCGCTNK